MRKSNKNYNESLFVNNLNFFIDIIKEMQKIGKYRMKDFAHAIGISPSTLTGWKNLRRNPTRINLKRLSEYISQILNIPYDLFEDGNALYINDFSEIYKLHLEQSLHNKQNIKLDKYSTDNYSINEKLPDYESAQYSKEEKTILPFLRFINGGPLSEPTIKRLKRFLELVQLDSDVQLSLTATLEAAERRRGLNGQRGKNNNKGAHQGDEEG